jgi:hypothetical protein
MTAESVIRDVAADGIVKKTDVAVPLRRNIASSKGRRESR